MDKELRDQIEDLAKKLEQIESTLNAAKKVIRRLENEYLKIDYSQIDGVVGRFDGNYLVTEQGEKYEVPGNYAAKSKLVYGDVLKVLEEDGKSIFKQIEKVDREKVEGILTKKEGEWYLLTDRGSYKVSDTAAEFHKTQLNDQATAYLPAGNLAAPFATLHEVESTGAVSTKPAVKPTAAPVRSEKTEKPARPARPAPSEKKPEKREDIKDLAGKEISLKPKAKEPKKAEKKPAESRGRVASPAKSAPSGKTAQKAPKKEPDSAEDKTTTKRTEIEEDDLV